MRYLHSIFLHNHFDNGVFYYYEIDNDGFINRQIEIYNDFTFGLASRNLNLEIGKTYLSDSRIENIDLLVHQEQEDVQNFIITKEHFNCIWSLLLNRSERDETIKRRIIT